MKYLLAAALILALCPAASHAGEASVPKEVVNPKDGYALVYIPAGEFTMGCPEGQGYDYEQPRHKVYLDGYYIGKYEVTVGQYKRFCKETGRTLPDQMGHGDNVPVIAVSQVDATAYSEWAGLSLSTEAQWEKAARGGTDTVYWWGDIATHDMANYTGKAGRDIWDDASPVGSFAPNQYGLYDVAGNVWEWCQDWYAPGYYKVSPYKNPTGPKTGESRVMRGGSWDSPADFLRSARRDYDSPYFSSNLLGFRCAITK